MNVISYIFLFPFSFFLLFFVIALPMLPFYFMISFSLLSHLKHGEVGGTQLQVNHSPKGND